MGQNKNDSPKVFSLESCLFVAAGAGLGYDWGMEAVAVHGSVPTIEFLLSGLAVAVPLAILRGVVHDRYYGANAFMATYVGSMIGQKSAELIYYSTNIPL